VLNKKGRWGQGGGRGKEGHALCVSRVYMYQQREALLPFPSTPLFPPTTPFPVTTSLFPGPCPPTPRALVPGSV
jgi:hypothetical protein